MRKIYLSVLENLSRPNIAWDAKTYGYVKSKHYVLFDVTKLHWCMSVAQFSKANNNEELRTIVENYQEVLRTKTNVKNLHMFVEAFHK